MSVFEYTGISKLNKNVKGFIDADSLKAAKAKLRKDGIFPTDINEEIDKREETKNDFIKNLTERISKSDISLMTRQFATLINAGLPMVESLSALIEQMDNVKLQKVITSIRESVNEGNSLADALNQHPNVFNNLYINMVKAGEASGALDIVLLRLADYQESQVKLVRKVQAIFAYPVLMMLVGTGVLTFLLTYVIPKVTRIFENYKKELPLPTKILITISNLLKNNWGVILILLIIGAYLLRRYVKTEVGKRKFDKFTLSVPIFSKLTRKIIISRFSRTLATLVKSGIPLLTSMGIVKNIVNNVIFEEAITDASVKVREGEGIAVTLKGTQMFPPLVTRMISVGERTGEIENMLEKIADTYEGEVETTVMALTSIIEPIMIIIMGTIIAFIVISILLPIFELNQINM
ncbi:type II secretion system inner membrane protein GspF [Thermodesulfobacteriota bacterium]